MREIIHVLALLVSLQPPVQPESISRSEIFCLAHVVYHEARGESFDGQAAVAHVVLNRVGRWQNDVCSVVYQKAQFSHIKKTQIKFDSRAWKKAVRIAALAYSRMLPDNTRGAVYFYAHKVVQPGWRKRMYMTVRIGNHTFLKEKVR